MSLLWGLNFSLALEITNVDVEGDSRVIIQAMHRKNSVGWRVGTILDDVNSQMQRFHNHKFGRMYNEGNGIADLIAATRL